MQNPQNLKLSKFLLISDYESFFEDDDFQEFEFDREFNHLLDRTDLDETDDFFWDDNKFNGNSN